MSRWSRLIPVLAVAALLAACSQDSDSPLMPSGPRFDGGHLVGGNVVEPPTTTTSSGETTTASTDEAPTEPTDTTAGRGGHLVGGN